METTQDVRQALEYGMYIRKLGWTVEEIDGINVFIKKIGPVAIAKIQRADVINWTSIKECLKRNRVIVTKYEPLSDKPNLRRSEPMLATRTLRVDLRPNKEDILKSFKKDCRYCLRRFKNHDLRIENNDFAEFYNLWKRANRVKHLWTPNYKSYLALVESFGEKCFCITLNAQAGAFVLLHNKVAYYYYAGGLPAGKKANLPYLVVWECMKEAKKRGSLVWDFEGIFDQRFPNKDILGYTHFKKSFGGKEIEFPGAFTKWFW